MPALPTSAAPAVRAALDRAAGDPAAPLARLFRDGRPLPAAEAAAALHPLAVADGFAAGLLYGDPAAPRAAVRLEAFDGLDLASDWPAPPDPADEPVMGVAATTRALAMLAVPPAGGRVLDLGTGCGVLALLAARAAGHVVATDLNPRAAALTRFNAALNGISGLDVRTGDLFAPVAGEAFDRVVCNPPFVIAPAAGRLHSQTGRPADDLLRAIVRAAPAHLRPGGYFQAVGNWVHPVGGDWRARLAGWVAGLGCDAWVLVARTEDAATYARRRIGETTACPAIADRRFAEWTAYYAAAGIEAVGFGLITLRRSAGPDPWFRCDQMPDLAGPCGAAVADWFGRQDFLAARRGDAALLAARVRGATDRAWDPPAAGRPGVLRRTTGLRFAGAADAAVADFVARCDGTARLGDALARLATARGLDPARFAPAFLAVVRRLVEVGILLPAADD